MTFPLGLTALKVSRPYSRNLTQFLATQFLATERFIAPALFSPRSILQQRGGGVKMKDFAYERGVALLR
jgi:hypothetical protein